MQYAGEQENAWMWEDASGRHAGYRKGMEPLEGRFLLTQALGHFLCTLPSGDWTKSACTGKEDKDTFPVKFAWTLLMPPDEFLKTYISMPKEHEAETLSKKFGIPEERMQAMLHDMQRSREEKT